MFNLFSWLTSAFGGTLAFFVSKTSKNVALLLTFITFVTGLTVTFFSALYSMAQSLTYSLVNPYLLLGVRMIWSPQVNLVLSVYISALITRWVYDRSVQYAKWTVEAGLI